MKHAAWRAACRMLYVVITAIPTSAADATVDRWRGIRTGAVLTVRTLSSELARRIVIS